MSDYHAAKSYIYARLDAALTVGVYEQPAPSTATYPLVTYSIEPQPDTRYKGGAARASFESVVRVIGKGSSGPLETHMDAIDTALDVRRGTARGLRVESVRIAPFRLPSYFQEGSNEPTQELGGRYMVRVME